MEKKIKKTKKLKLVPDKLTEENMEQVYKEKFEKINLLLDDPNYNSYLNEKELLNTNSISKQEDKFKKLYPSLDDPMLNIKIAQKKEFNDNKYDGKIYDIELKSSLAYQNSHLLLKINGFFCTLNLVIFNKRIP